ncbi:MAG: hypothetical protein ACYC61_31065 [Isosphaeraceae bacterium]
MATRSKPRKSVGEKLAAEKAPAKTATPSRAVTNGPAAPAGARAGAKTRRPRKGIAVSAETAKVLRDAEAGKNLLHYPSLEAMFEDLGI